MVLWASYQSGRRRQGSVTITKRESVPLKHCVSNLVSKYKLLSSREAKSPSLFTTLQGDVSNIYTQRFVLGQHTANYITIPLHLRLRKESRATKTNRVKGKSVKSGGWVTWFDEESKSLSSTTVAQWNSGTREQWLTSCQGMHTRTHSPICEPYNMRQGNGPQSDVRKFVQSLAGADTEKGPSKEPLCCGCPMTTDLPDSAGSVEGDGFPMGTSDAPTFGTTGGTTIQLHTPRILHLFVFLHGISAPSVFGSDVVENFGNLIATLIESFPRTASAETSLCDDALYDSQDELPQMQVPSKPSLRPGKGRWQRKSRVYTVDDPSMFHPRKDPGENECPWALPRFPKTRKPNLNRMDTNKQKQVKVKCDWNIFGRHAAKLAKSNQQRRHESIKLPEALSANEALPSNRCNKEILRCNWLKSQDICRCSGKRNVAASSPISGPARLLFVCYSYRKETWKSIDACISTIVPLLSQELGAHFSSWDEVRLYAVGHSLGGLLWRFLLLTRLQNVVHSVENLTRRGDTQMEHQRHMARIDYKEFNELLEHHRLKLVVLCTLASPHLGAFKSSLIYRSMPEAIAGLKCLPNSHYAQDLLLRSNEGLLATLATEELAGRSHLTFPTARCTRSIRSLSGTNPLWGCNASGVPSVKERVIGRRDQSRILADSVPSQSTNKEENTGCSGFTSGDQELIRLVGDRSGGNTTSVRCSARGASVTSACTQPPTANRFERVLLYGILETDWIVSIQSALATMEDIRRSKEGCKAIKRPMHPVCVNNITKGLQWTSCSQQGGRCFGINESLGITNSKTPGTAGRNRNIELHLARKHIHVFDHLCSIDRYAVYIDQNPVFLAPHGLLKGYSAVVSKDRQEHILREAKPLLTHIALHIMKPQLP